MRDLMQWDHAVAGETDDGNVPLPAADYRRHPI